MELVIAFLLVTLPLHGLLWLAIRHERQQLLRQYKASISRIQVRGL